MKKSAEKKVTLNYRWGSKYQFLYYFGPFENQQLPQFFNTLDCVSLLKFCFPKRSVKGNLQQTVVMF